MKKNQKNSWKRFAHVFTLIVMLAALVLGIIFSLFHVNSSLEYGPDFNGAFQASVQVIKQNNRAEVSERAAARGLQDKLSPFSDVPVTVSFVGRNHLSVTSGRAVYNNSQALMRAAIETTGGMFVFNRDQQSNDFEDLFTNQDALTAVGGSTRIAASDLFTERLSVESLATRNGRAPYVSLGLQTTNEGEFVWSNILSALEEKSQGTNYYFVTDFEALIGEIKDLYTIDINDDELIEAYWENVIKVGQDYLANLNDPQERETLRDVFSGQIRWTVRATGTGFTRIANISLLDSTFEQGIEVNVDGRRIRGINSVEDLKDILIGANFTSNPQRGLNYFMYQSDTTADDLNQEPYSQNRISSLNNVNLGSIQNTFRIITNFFLKNIILDETGGRDDSGTVTINSALETIDPTIKDHFVFNGGIFPNTDGQTTIPQLTSIPGLGFITIEIQNGTSNILPPGLYLPAQSLTVGRKAVASINQNALGIRYRVESIVTLNATITNTWIIIAIIVFMILLALLTIYLLFVYRLLGLFTIIIAVMTASLVFVFATLFSITVGPQLIMALFLTIGLTIDLSLILLDSFADKIYAKKQAIKTGFNIANKETLALTLDAIVVALIPNIIMFWVTTGDLKQFATIATIGVALVLFFGVLILRLGAWLILRLKAVQQTNVFLPIDTNFNLNLSFREQYLVHKYESFLEKHEGKEKYSSKELLKIKQTSEKLVTLNHSLEQEQLESINKMRLNDQREVEKLLKQIKTLENRKQLWYVKHFNLIGQKISTYYDLKIIELKSILENETFEKTLEHDVENQQVSSVAKRVKTLKTERRFNRTGIIMTFLIVILTVLATVIGFTVGPNWSQPFGRGQQFVVYGEEIQNTYNYTIGNQRPLDWEGSVYGDEAQRIAEEYVDQMVEAQDAIDEARSTGSIEDVLENQKRLYLLEAEQIKTFYSFIINNNIFAQINNRARTIDLQTWNIQVIEDYVFINPETGAAVNSSPNQIAITVNSNATNGLSRTNFRRLLVFLSNPASFPWNDIDDGNHRNETGGIVAYDLRPFTATELIKQILIVFGILLLALIIYMVIRFKWTYYVALALGLILSFAAIIGITVLFRIPISLELLSGFALLISFIVVTMIFILGKGKSLLNLDDKKSLAAKFAPEVQQAVLLREKRTTLQKNVEQLDLKLKKVAGELKQLKKKVRMYEDVDFDRIADLKQEQLVLKAERKNLLKVNKKELKHFKKETQANIKVLNHKNFFFKDLYMDLIRFTYRRLLTIGLFYLITAVILLTTLTPMFGMGLIILIGILVGFMVTLFVVIPLWIVMERSRLRNASGFKSFMTNVKVSREEQIVYDVND